MYSASTLPQIGLSTASVFPLGVKQAFKLAQELGYDGIENMVFIDKASQNVDVLRDLIQEFQLPVLSVHAPTLLLGQRIWGSEHWAKIDRSVAMAEAVGADVVVAHPPFRWQGEYAQGFAVGIEARNAANPRVKIAVENMYPWRAPGRKKAAGTAAPNTDEIATYQAYVPHWDLARSNYSSTTVDFSHAATAGTDLLALLANLGDRLTHIHLADGSGSFRDEHLVPGRGNQPVAAALEMLGEQRFPGHIVVEVGTRKATPEQRLIDLNDALTMARWHLQAGEENRKDRP